LDEVLQFLDLQPGQTVVDGTVGAAGHARIIQERIAPGGTLIGLDRDPLMLAHARVHLDENRCQLRPSSYADLRDVLDELGIGAVDRVLLDLGLSSDQLADDTRGFGFEAGGPLDMRFDASQGRPAADLVNRLKERDLADLIYKFGEERFSRRIARRIVAARPITTARQLAETVVRSVPRPGGRRPRIHPATRVFQALRIAVNDELGELERFLEHGLPACLAAGGRAVIITFHSLEDRLVKNAFRNKGVWETLTRKPVRATDEEQRANPRCRAAKLRAAVKRESG
jgi:16S rRNA (cytosine1402-N4)-methyltransferase